MKIRKWKRWKRRSKGGFKSSKKARLVVLKDDLKGAKRPPDWMRELLFSDSDDDQIAG